MGKSRLLEQGFQEKRKKTFIKKAGAVFYVKEMPKDISLSHFNLDLRVDLDAALRLSKINGKLVQEDIPKISTKS